MRGICGGRRPEQLGKTEGKLFLSVSSRLANSVNQMIDKYDFIFRLWLQSR